MKAAILVRHGAPLVVDEVDPLDLGQGQALVRIRASGICGKQINEIAGNCGSDKYMPHLLGHEGAGIVQEIGPGVTHFKPGDHVVLHWRKGAGIEAECPRYRWGDEFIGGGPVTTFNEYAVVSENRLTRIEDDIPLDLAALMGCAVTTGLGVVLNDARLQPGQSLAIIGCGGVGLNVIQGAKLAGAKSIWAIDPAEGKMLKAHEFGATLTSEVVYEFLPVPGPDIIVDTTGNPVLIAWAFALVAPGGKVIAVGQPPRGVNLVLPDFARNMKGKTLMDSQGGGTDPNADIPLYLTYWRRGLLKLKELITHRFPLEDVNEALDIMRSGAAGRIILEMA